MLAGRSICTVVSLLIATVSLPQVCGPERAPRIPTGPRISTGRKLPTTGTISHMDPWSRTERGSSSYAAAVKALLAALPGLSPTFVIVALLACVLIPLPTTLVDLLLSASLASAVLLLVASLGIRNTNEFLSFPTLLLLATLYRLALNISTTRLILSEGYAGRVIDAFSGFVVRGDIVVGGIMFLIITVVQYVVIARGAERVAEVAARFALDGLPGHQAAIDADLRAGAISAREAAERRDRLIERSGFFGAMDGAVRFVKGDAIAGLAITAINLGGGMIMGVTRVGLGWQESLDHYGRLTVGDGLLAQIPALLVSLAAGVLAARVDERRSSPRATLYWLEPAMLLVPAVLLGGLALVPGMPGLAFSITAVGLGITAVWMSSRRHSGATPNRLDEILIRVPADEETLAKRLAPTVGELAARCSQALGVDIPAMRLEPREDTGKLSVHFAGRVLGRVELPASGREDAAVLAIFRAVMDNAEALLDLQSVDAMLENLRATHPVVVQQALAAVDLPTVLQIVRGLLRERIPVPHLPALLGVIAEDPRFRKPSERARFCELVRERLAPYWLHDVLEAHTRLGEVTFVRPTPDLEDALGERANVGIAGVAVELTTDERNTLVERIRARTRGAHQESPIMLIATPHARPIVAAALRGSTPPMAVLSTGEMQSAGLTLPKRTEWIDVE